MWSAEAADPGRSPETHAAVIGKILFFMGLPAEPGSGALLMPKNRLKARGRAVPLQENPGRTQVTKSTRIKSKTLLWELV